ncbi:hypothetical protein PLICRDRAFT_254239 [Plicaturopsis crispa FD-325 SS-3]|nr:hypothetical protein PLICRDRAFT_254239 [Plicaturopsis crispa FD-325 SS-3]
MAVKIEPRLPHREGDQGAASSSKGKAVSSRNSTAHRFKNSDLPLDYNGLQTWRSLFVPSFTAYAATFQTSGWNLRSVPGLADDVQKIWDAIFPNIHEQVTLNGPVIYVALQRGYEFHSSLKDAATAAVELYWHSDPLYSTPEERAKFVAYMLGPDDRKPESAHQSRSRRLMWLDPERRKGTFRSEIVLRTFSAYLNIAQKSIADFGRPIGVLCISTAAVERALRIWASGKFDAEEAKKDFSEGRWSNVALAYAGKARNLTDSKWERLITDARAFTKSTRLDSEAPASVAAPEDAPLDEDDGVSVSSTSDQE